MSALESSEVLIESILGILGAHLLEQHTKGVAEDERERCQGRRVRLNRSVYIPSHLPALELVNEELDHGPAAAEGVDASQIRVGERCGRECVISDHCVMGDVVDRNERVSDRADPIKWA